MAYRRNSNNGSGLISGVIIFLLIIAGLVFAFTGSAAMIVIFVVILFASFIILAIVKSPSFKGKMGENKVARFLANVAQNKDGYVINDVIIPSKEGETTQIDHILFTNNGVFVIETKNISGLIYGDEIQKYWTQVLAYGKTKHRLYNPVKQNQTHINCLKELLPYSGINYVSCVVFVSGDISNVNSEHTYTYNEFKKFIKDNVFINGVTSNNIKLLYDKVKHYKDNPIKTNKEHALEVKKKHKK